MDTLEMLLLVGAALGMVAGLYAGYRLGKTLAETRCRAEFDLQRQSWEKDVRADAVKRSRVTLGGKFSEQIAPYFPGFAYDPTDARFLGSPIDLVIFDGMAAGDAEEIVFMEIKTGNAQLSKRERKIKELVEHKKVRWELYRLPATEQTVPEYRE